MRPTPLLTLFAIFLAGCAETTFEDSGTKLARVIVRGAKRLRASDANEIVVRYEPMHGINQEYDVDIYHTGPQKPGTKGNCVEVRCETGGYTGWHQRYVYVPRDLHVAKSNQDTAIILRKVGDRIDVVAVH
jgi:hypothetical protein